ncbi:MAG: NAD-dependent epimerase/dehydratase family protein, partial [Anaerolineales bacterium]|nr:NAD-dependent epimerase/dehydratase family protein [Anaerolineales bacterium]
MPESNYWSAKRVIITGGAGFLGSFVTEKLAERGAMDILIPRIEFYDLTQRENILRLLDDAMLPLEKRPRHLRPTNLLTFQSLNLPTFKPSNLVILHLAARVGGIGANREHPAEFFYDNLMMGAEL